jgi:hypothetical protein
MLLTIYNGPSPTTASQAGVTTGTAIKTLLQVALKTAVTKARIVEWGISFDAANATPVECELCETDVAATVTAHVAAGINKTGDPNDPDPTTNLIDVGTAKTGYTASVEGSITTMRMHDCQQVVQSYVKQYPLGREPIVDLAKFLRVRVKAAVASNAICYVVVEL